MVSRVHVRGVHVGKSPMEKYTGILSSLGTFPILTGRVLFVGRRSTQHGRACVREIRVRLRQHCARLRIVWTAALSFLSGTCLPACACWTWYTDDALTTPCESQRRRKRAGQRKRDKHGARSGRHKRLVPARSRTRWRAATTARTSTGLAEARGTGCNARREVEDIDCSK